MSSIHGTSWARWAPRLYQLQLLLVPVPSNVLGSLFGGRSGRDLCTGCTVAVALADIPVSGNPKFRPLEAPCYYAVSFCRSISCREDSLKRILLYRCTSMTHNLYSADSRVFYLGVSHANSSSMA
ncbi:hypothetical protein EDB89DRAFT_566534 [Lactarius sanguifluus]|nr:hypothetical protein EDB89DRAFT_566534 [Lactarius sanguifluus]